MVPSSDDQTVLGRIAHPRLRRFPALAGKASTRTRLRHRHGHAPIRQVCRARRCRGHFKGQPRTCHEASGPQQLHEHRILRGEYRRPASLHGKRVEHLRSRLQFRRPPSHPTSRSSLTECAQVPEAERRTSDHALRQMELQAPDAQSNCPLVRWYSVAGARRLVETCGFEVTSIEKRHIFPWRVDDYIQHHYVKAFPWNIVPHRSFESILGHHLLVKARLRSPKTSATTTASVGTTPRPTTGTSKF